MLGRIKKIHFIGLGGIGISGMAEFLLGRGFVISGSDARPSEITGRLAELGVQFFEGHDAANVTTCDIVVYSSAVPQDNPEIVAALARKIPVIRRAEMLGELLRVTQTSIAVSGTHGKTTTSSMIGAELTAADRDPTMIIGGIVKSLGTNTRTGQGDLIVVEADEFDRSFLSLMPTIAVITNIDAEHLDCYKNMDDLIDAFTQFGNAVPFYGRVIACLDDSSVQTVLARLHRPVTTYGLSAQADVRAQKLNYSESRTEFRLRVNGHAPVTVVLNVPGEHNVRNALAAIATGLELEIPLDMLIAGLEAFSGVNRRFEITAESGNVIFVDDYAHHPREVVATLQAAKEGWNRRIVAVFQPHLYSRTRDFHEEFAQAFLDCDVLVVTDIYGAREEPIEGITGELIANNARQFGHKRVYHVTDLDTLAATVANLIQEGDMVLTLGAGSITHYNRAIREAYLA